MQKPFLASSMDLLQQEGIVFPRFQLVQDVLVVLLPTLQHLCHANPLGRLLGEDSIRGCVSYCWQSLNQPVGETSISQ